LLPLSVDANRRVHLTSQGAVVDFSEGFQRIVRGHWVILAVCVVLGVGVGIVVSRNHHATYTATTRVALGSTTPQTEAEAAAISSVAQAIATSSSQVRDALNAAKVPGDSGRIARDDVSVRSLGTSNIVELSVRDRDPAVAQKVANALSAEVERAWLAIGHGQTPQVVKDLQSRLDDLNQRIASLDSQINTVVDPGKGTDPVRTLLARREDLARQAAALETERDRVVSQDALDVRASIVQTASLPSSADNDGHAQTIFLGGLVGLLVGLGLAALVEALHPTLIGSRRVAAGAGTALLGRLDRLPEHGVADPVDVSEVATRIALAASVARVESVQLVAAPEVDLEPLATALGADRTPANGRKPRTRETPILHISVVDRARLQRGRSTGLVIVSPTRVSASALDEVRDLVAISGWPVLGAVTYEQATLRHRVVEHVNGSGGDRADAPDDSTSSSFAAATASTPDHERGVQ
jgi:capsular polysaccharide biosynthesis protein